MNGQLYVVPELTTTFQQWNNQPGDFISQFIMPEVQVADVERFLVWAGGKEHLTIPSTTLRTGRTKFAESTFSQSVGEKGPLQEHGLSAFLTQRMYNLSKKQGGLSLENRVVENLASQMRLLDEQDVANTFSSTSIITHYDTLSGADRWDNYGSSDPIEDIKNMIIAQRAYSPMPPNAAWCSWETWMKGLATHPVILDKFKWTQAGLVSQEQFLTLLAPLGIKKLYIGAARKNSAVEGLTPTMVDLWPKHFWVGYVTDSPGQFEINGGYKFTGGPEVRKVFKETSMNPPGAELVNSDFYDHIMLSADVYYMLQTVIS